MADVVITQAGPLVSVQDFGRPGMLRYGIAASGPMDEIGFRRAITLAAGATMDVVECGAVGFSFRVEGEALKVGFSGGAFALSVNGKVAAWDGCHRLAPGDEIVVRPGVAGNFGYVCFGQDFNLPQVMGSRSTNLLAQVGGLDGRCLAPGDRMVLHPRKQSQVAHLVSPVGLAKGPLHLIWGLHAAHFSDAVRARFLDAEFKISPQMDRTGMRLTDPSGVFIGPPSLSLVSDAIVPGDIQILGDGTPVILMRDHQATGGYPRIATLIPQDLSRVAQMRAGATVRFVATSIDRAQERKY